MFFATTLTDSLIHFGELSSARITNTGSKQFHMSVFKFILIYMCVLSQTAVFSN
jgi:hypothetical protein